MAQRPLKMIKRQFSLAKPDFKWLLDEAKDLGVSVSELVRRAINDFRLRSVRR